MGWDHHAALEHAEGGALPAHSRSDSNSLYEVFTLPQLVAAFDVPLINHRRAAVDMAKLDFLNKMTIRRKAGRLGRDGNLMAVGKEGADIDGAPGNEDGRGALVERYQAGLREVNVLAGRCVLGCVLYG
jgi:glutamyl-tRNA synthetase